jgi:Flp pilus assembly protein TadD
MEAELSAVGSKDSDDDPRIAARRRLVEKERVAIRAEMMHLSGDPRADERRLQSIRERYPWDSSLWRHAGLIQGVAGDLDKAYESFVGAILLQPSDPLNWMALARLAELRHSPRDARVLSEIASTITAALRGI